MGEVLNPCQAAETLGKRLVTAWLAGSAAGRDVGCEMQPLLAHHPQPRPQPRELHQRHLGAERGIRISRGEGLARDCSNRADTTPANSQLLPKPFTEGMEQ